MSFKLDKIFLKNKYFKHIQNNKYVLYLVALIALIDILGYIMRHEFSAVIFFYLVGMITYYYTKNMTLVLTICLVVTSFAHLIKNQLGFKEGLEVKEEDFSKNNKKNEDESLSSPQKKEIIDRISLQEKKAKQEQEQEQESITDGSLSDTNKKKLDDVSSKANKILKTLEKKGVKSGYQNKEKLSPGLYNIPNKEQLTKQLGEADKIESAYDNLEQVIGENGIKSMSNATKDLVRQQNELLKGLKEVTPALNEAMGAIGKIDLGSLSDMFKKTMPNSSD
jgi:hypothetical protein